MNVGKWGIQQTDPSSHPYFFTSYESHQAVLGDASHVSMLSLNTETNKNRTVAYSGIYLMTWLETTRWEAGQLFE